MISWSLFCVLILPALITLSPFWSDQIFDPVTLSSFVNFFTWWLSLNILAIFQRDFPWSFPDQFLCSRLPIAICRILIKPYHFSWPHSHSSRRSPDYSRRLPPCSSPFRNAKPQKVLPAATSRVSTATDGSRFAKLGPRAPDTRTLGPYRLPPPPQSVPRASQSPPDHSVDGKENDVEQWIFLLVSLWPGSIPVQAIEFSM